MEPWIGTALQYGMGSVALIMLYVLHREALSRFSQEMNLERKRNDENLTRFFGKLDELTDALQLAKCRYEGECTMQVPHLKERK